MRGKSGSNGLLCPYRKGSARTAKQTVSLKTIFTLVMGQCGELRDISVQMQVDVIKRAKVVFDGLVAERARCIDPDQSR